MIFVGIDMRREAQFFLLNYMLLVDFLMKHPRNWISSIFLGIG